MLTLVDTVRETAEKIRKLEVQGARNVAIAAIEAVEGMTGKTKVKTREEFMDRLAEARDIFFASRPTEPLMRNAIRWIINSVKSSRKNKVSDLARIVSSCSCEFLRSLEESRECIAEIGAKRIRDGMVIFTHCHSSTVTCMLTKAKQNGRKFEVICTETRPVLQGRTTATEMLALGVKTTFIVDSAARSFMKKPTSQSLGQTP